MTRTSTIESWHFQDDGRTPNNPVLPLLVLRQTEAADAGDPAAWFEQRFVSNGWSATWRWGVYPFHHFHTTNHEVLGVARGEAKLLLGGEKGDELNVGVGDVIVIPAGVSHKCLEASGDFQVVGAYPRGDDPDLVLTGEGDIEQARQCIAEVPLPERDPVFGENGPLIDYWKIQD